MIVPAPYVDGLREAGAALTFAGAARRDREGY
jgi:hypothetical protein